MNEMNKYVVEVAEEKGMLYYLWNHTDFLYDLPDYMKELIIKEVGE